MDIEVNDKNEGKCPVCGKIHPMKTIVNEDKLVYYFECCDHVFSISYDMSVFQNIPISF